MKNKYMLKVFKIMLGLFIDNKLEREEEKTNEMHKLICH